MSILISLYRKASATDDFNGVFGRFWTTVFVIRSVSAPGGQSDRREKISAAHDISI